MEPDAKLSLITDTILQSVDKQCNLSFFDSHSMLNL
jgi:hypothetical protein